MNISWHDNQVRKHGFFKRFSDRSSVEHMSRQMVIISIIVGIFAGISAWKVTEFGRPEDVLVVFMMACATLIVANDDVP